jgi:hypothetical protein
MTEPKPSKEQVVVTGEERTHPAYTLLARAMILLARLTVGGPAQTLAAPTPESTAEPRPADASNTQAGDASGSEAGHE